MGLGWQDATSKHRLHMLRLSSGSSRFQAVTAAHAHSCSTHSGPRSSSPANGRVLYSRGMAKQTGKEVLTAFCPSFHIFDAGSLFRLCCSFRRGRSVSSVNLTGRDTSLVAIKGPTVVPSRRAAFIAVVEPYRWRLEGAVSHGHQCFCCSIVAPRGLWLALHPRLLRGFVVAPEATEVELTVRSEDSRWIEGIPRPRRWMGCDETEEEEGQEEDLAM